MDAALKYYTAEDIWALPEGQRAEIIDGEWYDMASPTGTHQWIITEITGELHTYLRQKGFPCRVFVAPFAVYPDNDNSTYVEPDITVLCDMGKYDEHGIYGAPDLVIEVASPGSARLDYGKKLFKYHSAGVREYWIINPMTKTVNTYHFSVNDDTEEGYVYTFDEDIAFGLYPDLTLNMNKLLVLPSANSGS